MESNIYISELIRRYPQLLLVENEIVKAAAALISCYLHGNKVLLCGNGGSCSDADHIAGELMKSFEHKRPIGEPFRTQLLAYSGERGKYLSENLQQGLPAISLGSHNGLLTAIANDTDADLIFAQQVIAYGNAGDVLIGISTSGNSQNVVDALITARAKEMVVIGLTGETGGRMKPFCDILINVPETRTMYVQELHLPVYHAICAMVENSFFGVKK